MVSMRNICWTVVTICTASLTFNNPTFCPHSVFMCFVWIWEQTAIISLYNINWLVCITETECVYCAVRTELLRFRVILVFSPSTAQAFIRQPFTAKTRVWCQVGPCEICVDKSDNLTGFSPVLPFLLSIKSHQFSIFTFHYCCCMLLFYLLTPLNQW